MFLIDTDVISIYRRKRDARVKAWMDRQRSGDLFISAISIGEIERGIHLQRSTNVLFADELAQWLDLLIVAFNDRIIPFNRAEARRWGRLAAAIGHSNFDLQIAATALEHGLTVVTRNVSHFEPTGVSIVDPFASRP